MFIKPVVKQKKEEVIDVQELMKQAAQQAAEQTRKTLLETDTGDGKLSDVLKNIRNKSYIKSDDDSLIDCPTCHRGNNGHEGHVHKLKNDKGILKCTGPDCGSEYIIVPKVQAEYICETCGAPHLKIDTRNKELRKSDVCLGCGSDHFKMIGIE